MCRDVVFVFWLIMLRLIVINIRVKIRLIVRYIFRNIGSVDS